MLAVWFGTILIMLTRASSATAANYTISLSTTGSGTAVVTPDQPTYAHGTSVTLEATPAAGWHFVEWQGNFDTPEQWWNDAWRYRVPLSIASGDFARQDKPAELALDFTDLLGDLSASGPFDPASIRVVEVDTDGAVVNTAVPFQFDKDADYNASTNAAGTLVLLLTGTTPANTARHYHIYFDTTDNGPFSPAAVAPRVTVQDNVPDEGQTSYLITTTNSAYYYHKKGGGFSSLNDNDGNDWINYHPVDGSSGNYRGIPNLYGGIFHPRAWGGSSTLLSSGPLRASILTEFNNPYRAARWDIYPAYATMTLLVSDGPYWFLYEGTPGGELEIGKDFLVRSDGTQTPASTAWTGDIVGPEWVYFADPTVERALFVVNHTEDEIVDSYYQLDKVMTVFGFGRSSTNAYMEDAPAQFSIGLIDDTDYATAGPQVNAAYTAVTPTVGIPEFVGLDGTRTDPTLALDVTNNLDITAVFEPDAYTLSLSTIGSGSVTATPDKATYAYGDQVALIPQPAENWAFAFWTGGISSPDTPLLLTIESDLSLTAVFVPTYTLTTSSIGNGTITVSPQQDRYAEGSAITLTTQPAAGWMFDHWEGDASGSTNPLVLAVEEDLDITAVFVQISYESYIPFISRAAASQ